MYRILSFDGGGIRGVLAAALLERLERVRPGWLSQVDLLAGASTGAILALGLAAGLTPTVLRKLYELHSAAIFADDLLDDVRDLGNAVGAQYSNEPLRRMLDGYFGDARLADLPRRVLVSAFDLDNDPADPQVMRAWKPKFFHNYPGPGSDGQEKVVDVALRTTAAPSYFPIYQGYIDGGLVANCPSTCALAQALEPGTGGQKLEDVWLLSLGTGRSPRYLTARDDDWGWAQWARPLASIVFGDGLAGVADYQCRQFLGPRYHRINPVLPAPVALDAVDQIPAMIEIARQADLAATVKWLDDTNESALRAG